MRLFLSDDTHGSYAILPPDESKHCVRVLRMTAGDELWVTSGDGVMCRAHLTVPDERSCEVEIIERLDNYQPRPFCLHLAVAPTKNPARLEWLVEKAVEIGIDRITPLLCDHSERMHLKTERLDRIALSAMKQSLKARRPAIDPAISLDSLLSSLPEPSPDARRLVCHCADSDRRSIRQLYAPGQDVLVLIGPEGDFSPREITLALDHGFHPVTLGNSRLRTETAALYAITALNFMNV